jgi:hypothetical protein
MKKTDVVGIVIYTGLSGTVLVLVGILLFDVVKSLIFGA